MSETLKSWIRPLRKILIAISIPIALYLFAFFVSRSVLDSLYRGIESSKATGLAAFGPPMLQSSHAYRSTDDLLQTGGIDVVRAASLALEVQRFDVAAPRLREIAQQAGGFLDEFKIHRQSGASPWLEAKLHLPANLLDSALATIRSLGRVKQETESNESTSAEKESLSVQMESKRAELAHLNEIVKHRSGSLSDSVATEEKISERRNELKDLEKRWNKLESRVEYALIELQIGEQYQARLDWRTAIIFSDLRNSFIEGVDATFWSFAAVMGFLFRYGLVLFLWACILYWPSRSVWRRYRHTQSFPSASI